MAAKKTKKKAAAAPPKRRKKGAEPASRGLTPAQVASGAPPARVKNLEQAIEGIGGRVLGAYREPLGGGWHVLAVLPVDRVAPTPYQRDLSDSHVKRLAGVIDQIDRFVDPIVVVRAPDGGFWTPNGNHRLAAMRLLGARSIVALVLLDETIAFRILALNTEKAHNVREKALEVIRMARELARMDPLPEKAYEIEFEEPALLTLGICYERNGRFSGGAYQSVLKRVESFQSAALPKALEMREKRADRLMELDEAVATAVAALKARGFQSPYLKAFVLARINPLRFQRGAKAEFDTVIPKMVAAAGRFDVSKVKADQLAASSGAPADAD